jgi:hypothetical protein
MQSYVAVPEEIARHADTTLDVAVDLGDAFPKVRAALGVPPAAFGDPDVGGLVASTHTEAVDALEETVGLLLQAYGRAGYNLYGAAFSYQELDQKARGGFRLVTGER